ncbi:MAG: selenocysteine-specific translation elongation factor [Acidobacteriaceae bacterium]
MNESESTRQQAGVRREKSVVVGTAGHIDHGKTALVRALTGTDTDRLPEEKRRGITIDLGFASLDMHAADGTPLQVSFVDVPGHHAFVRNMLAGAGGIDCVMLVISAEEGVKPQTLEHLAICTLLGITRGLTVLTKIDAVSEDRLRAVCAEVAQALDGSFLNGAPMLPVSAFSGQGMDALTTELRHLALQIPERSAEALPRMPLDRAFTMRGFGTVVTGTLLAGAIKSGEALVVQPGNRKVRVRGMQIHGRDELAAHAAARVALNLSGIEVGDVRRGDTLVPAGTLTATDTIDIQMSLLPDAPAVKHRSRLRLHAFTSDTLASVSLYDYQPVSPGAGGIARLRLTRPILILPGDRLVLRQCSPAITIGGGRVLDAHPLPRIKKTECLKWLEAMRSAITEGPGVSIGERQLLLRVARRETGGIGLDQLVTETGWSGGTVRAMAAPLIARGILVSTADSHLVVADALDNAAGSIMAGVKQAGGAAIKRSELRSHTGLTEQVFGLALDRLLAGQKLEVKGELVSIFGAAPRISDIDLQRLAAIEQAYAAAGLAAPLLRDVGERLGVGSAELRRLMTLLLRENKLLKLSADDLYMHRDALEKLKTQIKALRGQSMDVARFKEITGLSRKYAIPLLEHLDRERITRKQGETRLVL